MIINIKKKKKRVKECKVGLPVGVEIHNLGR